MGHEPPESRLTGDVHPAGSHSALAGPRTRVGRFTSHRGIVFLGLMFYYLAIILGLILVYGKGDFSTPSFIYQGF